MKNQNPNIEKWQNNTIGKEFVVQAKQPEFNPRNPYKVGRTDQLNRVVL